jgi:hypothetical protein
VPFLLVEFLLVLNFFALLLLFLLGYFESLRKKSTPRLGV